MSRISSLILALLLLWSCCAEDTLISPENIVANTSNYKTSVAEIGVFSKTAQGSVSIYYTKTATVKYEGPTARYDQLYVKRGDEVTEGQLLMSLTIEPDEVALLTARLNLTRAQEDREAQCQDYEDRIAEAKRVYGNETDYYAKQLRYLELEKLSLQYEKYLLQVDKSIAELTATLEELEADSRTQYVYAPFDGVIQSVEYFRTNEFVYNGTQVATLYDPDQYLISYDNSEGKLRYNMQVTLEVGPNKERQTGTGRVVACGNAKPGTDTGSTALIAIESFEGELPTQLTRPTVYYSYVYLENVVLINRSAITLYGGKYYVYKLDETGMVSKRYINHVTGGSDQKSWVVWGVEEGETVIIN